jgi:hypothetical protein
MEPEDLRKFLFCIHAALCGQTILMLPINLYYYEDTSSFYYFNLVTAPIFLRYNPIFMEVFNRWKKEWKNRK